MQVIFEILKITIPALIVFATAWYFLKQFTNTQYQLKYLETRQQSQQQTLTMQCTALERMALFCERISIYNLLLRMESSSQSVRDLEISMLLTIQQEYEYNLTQQIYVSAELWQVIRIARDHTVETIRQAASTLSPQDPAQKLRTALTNLIAQRDVEPLSKAIDAIRMECKKIMSA